MNDKIQVEIQHN